MKSLSTKLAVVIVSYNNINFLKNCIKSIKDSSTSVDKIIIVDNNSTDGTQEWLRGQKDVVTFLLSKNRGGSFAYNFGIKKALNLGMEYVLTTDEDTFFETNCIQNLYTKIVTEKVDFAVARVLTIEGETNKNNSTILKDEKIYASTFVGALFTKKVFSLVGLPYQNMFRFYDDIIFFLNIYNQFELKGVIVQHAYIYHFSQGISKSEYFQRFNKTKHSNFFIRNHFFYLRKRDGYKKTLKNLIRLTIHNFSENKVNSFTDKFRIAGYAFLGIIFIPKQ